VLVGAGIGALALIYCRVVLLRRRSRDLPSLAGRFVVFAGACSTLVLADDQLRL
jgi:hypothetical protein